MNRYCITRMKGKILSFLLDENGHALEIHGDTEQGSVLGNICIGKVQRVAKKHPGGICGDRPRTALLSSAG